MGQIIHLPSAYPSASSALDSAEAVLLLGIRWWVADRLSGDDPVPRLRRAFGIAGAERAAFPLDRLMAIVARSARQVVSIHRPRCPCVGRDEQHLLHAAALAQQGEADLAARALRTALLSAQGADFALAPLEGLGRLLAQARLFFRSRHAPQVPPDSGTVWPDRMFSRVVH